MPTIVLSMSIKKNRHRPLRRKGRAPSFSKEILGWVAVLAASGKLIPLKGDASFKMFLSGPSPESNACLRYLLSALTCRDVAKAKVTNAELLPEYAKGKMPRMDVNCEFNDGQKADIELQLTKADDDQKLRSLYYACKLYAGSLKQGAKYRSAPSVYRFPCGKQRLSATQKVAGAVRYASLCVAQACWHSQECRCGWMTAGFWQTDCRCSFSA